jgi:predicted RNA polymerase sigma factor
VTDWRAVLRLVPEVLGALARRYGHFDACEDAVQEALVAAAAQWPVPHPRRAAGPIGRRDAGVEPTLPRQHPRSAERRHGARVDGSPAA